MIKIIANYSKKLLKPVVLNNHFIFHTIMNIFRFSGIIHIKFSMVLKRILILISTKNNIAPIHHQKASEYIEDNKMFCDHIEIYPESKIYNKKPHTIENKIHWVFEEEYCINTPSVFIIKLENGRVFGNEGIIVTKDNIVLEDFSTPIRKDPGESNIFKKIFLPSPEYIDGKVAILSSQVGQYFFHWLFDVLPKIYILKQCGCHPDKIIVNEIKTQFQKETLEILKYLDISIAISEKDYLQAHEMIVPSLPGNTGHMPKWVCDFLRDSFLPVISKNNKSKKKRLYISRDKSSNGRKVLNEKEIMNILKPLGFELIFSEEISFKEQVELFHNSEVIIAPHGAGLSNIVFCDPKTQILEFFSPNYVNPCYYTLANQVDLNYYYLMSEGKRPPDFYDPHIGHENIFINIDSLLKMLNYMKLT